jgi:predicted HD superfamily hydrolase involved in NAD metabolism
VAGISYEVALAATQRRLGKKAAKHCTRVSDVAGGLALVYGVDPEDARLAGLLHDWARERDDEQLLADAATCGIEVTPATRAVPYLVHGAVAACEAEGELGELGEDIRDAIVVHTTGAVEMTSLAMVVYVADMIEPSRDFHGVDELREAVGVAPLEDLFALAYERSLKHLVKSRRYIHPVTTEVWNRYVAGRPR